MRLLSSGSWHSPTTCNISVEVSGRPSSCSLIRMALLMTSVSTFCGPMDMSTGCMRKGVVEGWALLASTTAYPNRPGLVTGARERVYSGL